jgi:hypothetical protein
VNYTKKPVQIQALQWNGTEERFREIQELAKDSGRLINRNQGTGIEIPTMEGVMTANLEDYIIKGVEGEVYPCKPKIFKATYDITGSVVTKHLDFGEILVFLKKGSTVARVGWNGKNMFAFMMPAESVSTAQVIEELPVPKAVRKHYVSQFSHNGWRPTLPDLLANDWYIVDL